MLEETYLHDWTVEDEFRVQLTFLILIDTNPFPTVEDEFRVRITFLILINT